MISKKQWRAKTNYIQVYLGLYYNNILCDRIFIIMFYLSLIGNLLKGQNVCASIYIVKQAVNLICDCFTDTDGGADSYSNYQLPHVIKICNCLMFN